jgi:hypothetical protein
MCVATILYRISNQRLNFSGFFKPFALKPLSDKEIDQNAKFLLTLTRKKITPSSPGNLSAAEIYLLPLFIKG